MGKLLIVSWTVHPWPTGSSVIINNIASQFKREELIILGEKPPAKLKHTWPDDYPEIKYFDAEISIYGRGQKYLQWFKINRLVKVIKRIIESEDVDKVLCVYPNDFFLYASYKVSKQKQIPFYTWFHNTYYDNETGLKKILAGWLQPKVFQQSERVMVMSDGMKQFYDKQYPQLESHTLRHGFPLPPPPKNTYSSNSDKTTFVFTGSLNESCRDASVRLMKALIKSPTNEIHIYSGNPKARFSDLGILGENVIYHGFIELDRLYGQLPKYDIMLLPHGFDGERTTVEYETIFPTRTIPLLRSGKPILAHSPKDVFLTSFLNENECALNVTVKSEAEILDAVEKLRTDKMYVDELVSNALKTSEMFEIDRIASRLKILIDF
ncbi:glycosyltransferase family protein [Portibacter marinus]|uniref:hypothetical protein n=1 Tax=Portibacter marinus TaxID=2898660 RepID=UPI001F46D0B5|nr:hypothetical protein [Portibacter marinus]